jgi:hypothetical protein
MAFTVIAASLELLAAATGEVSTGMQAPEFRQAGLGGVVADAGSTGRIYSIPAFAGLRCRHG